MSSDRNLLLGILAVQMNLVGRDALIQAMHACVLGKQWPLADFLVQKGELSAERRQLVDALVAGHLMAHDNVPHEHLATISSIEEIARSLRNVYDLLDHRDRLERQQRRHLGNQLEH